MSIELRSAERDLQQAIADTLKERGICFIKAKRTFPTNLPKGWPDFTFAYRGVPFALECKSPLTKHGRAGLSVEQEGMRLLLVANGWHHHVVTSLIQLDSLLR